MTVNPLIAEACSLASAIAQSVPESWLGRSGGKPPQRVVLTGGHGGSPASAPDTVFVSWAHQDEGWTEEQARDWQTQVARFVVTLRRNGIEADVDLFHLDERGVDWTRFGPQKVTDADIVLIVMSQAWADRWEGRNNPKVGAGAVAEADELRGLFARDQESWQQKTIIVLLPEVASGVVPAGLARLTRFSVDPYEIGTYESLLRALTAQPSIELPPLGPVPVMPPRFSSDEAQDVDSWIAYRGQQRRMDSRKRTSGVTDEQADDMVSRESLVQGVIDALRES